MTTDTPAPAPDLCTLCGLALPIEHRSTLEPGLPYQMCGLCLLIVRTSSDEQLAVIRSNLWQRAELAAAAPEGRA